MTAIFYFAVFVPPEFPRTGCKEIIFAVVAFKTISQAHFYLQ